MRNILTNGIQPSDRRINTWECTQYLIRALDRGGEAEVARLANQLRSEQVENARALAYRLFAICERKGWAQEAIAYNTLITSWTHIQEARTSSEVQEAQQEFNIAGVTIMNKTNLPPL